MSAPTDYADFLATLDVQRAGLPKRLRQCADFFDSHPEQVAFSTVAQVAEGAGVQPSAVMRFAQVLGFSGYSELQNLFRARYADQWPDYTTRLARMRGEGRSTADHLLVRFAEAGVRSLAGVTEGISAQDLDNTIKCLASVSMIHIAGFRRAFPVAAYLAYLFEKEGRPCRLIDGAGMLGSGAAFNPGHGLIAISFAPYTQQTIDLCNRAARAGAKVVAVSDARESPLFGLADHRLEIKEEDVGDFRTLAASFALAATLAVAVGSENP